MRLRTPAGRAGRPWLTRRLAVARRGADVLDEKRRALLRDRARLVGLVEETRQAWELAVGEADAWLRRALLVSGRRPLALAAFYVSEPADVRLGWRRTLGVTYPTDPQVVLPATSRVIPAGGSSALGFAASSYCAAVEAGVRYAVARCALERVDAELAATMLRLRALERRWIPAHETALSALVLELDETEREEAVRARWFVEAHALTS